MPQAAGATFAQLNATFHIFTQLFGLPAPLGPINAPPHSSNAIRMNEMSQRNNRKSHSFSASSQLQQQFISGMIAFGNVNLEINSHRPGGVAFQQCGIDVAMAMRRLQRKNLSVDEIVTPGLWTNLMLTGFGRGGDGSESIRADRKETLFREGEERDKKRALSQFPAWASEFYTFVCQYDAFDQSELREASWKYILSQAATGPLGMQTIATLLTFCFWFCFGLFVLFCHCLTVRRPLCFRSVCWRLHRPVGPHCEPLRPSLRSNAFRFESLAFHAAE
jgi:hypothetical protein